MKLLCIFLAAMAVPTLAQGSKADYERAFSVEKRLNDTVFRDRVTPSWMAEGQLWYRVATGPAEFEFVFADGPKGLRRLAFDHEKLAAALGEKLKIAIAPRRLPFSGIVMAGEQGVFFSAGEKSWHWDGAALGDGKKLVGANSLPASGRVRPSQRTGLDSAINFSNLTAGEVRLFWSSTDGALVPYETLEPGESHRQHTFGGHVWVAKDKSGKLLGVFMAQDVERDAIVNGVISPEEPAKNPEPAKPTPFRPFIRESNVWINDNGQEVQLSRDGSAENPYRDRFSPSPDGGKLVAMQVRPAQERRITLVESSPKDQVQPRLKVIDYLKPGDQIQKPRPRLFDVKTRREIPVSDALFNNPWSLGELKWEADGGAFSFLHNQRGHQVMRLVRVDAVSGEAKAVIEETSATFIDYSQKTYLRRLDKTNEILWASERDGWNHIYLFDARTGRLKSQITRGPWVVRQVEKVDEEKRQLWFRGLGMRAGQDPLNANLARVNFDGSGLQILTEGDGEHSYQISPDGNWLVDTYARPDLPSITTLRNAQNGKLACNLETADASRLLKNGFAFAERFMAKGRDGKTEIYGVIIKPTNFDATKKYPVIEQIYAGPQDYYTPKGYSRFGSLRKMADLSFIVVQLDGMGTNWRNKAFHDVCWKNLKDGGLPDRIAWIKTAATTRPWMDISRVGIYGGSAGGQNALAALLWHGDFYKAAAADCGCHDNRMDKIWWNEAWMGWPVGPEYAANSNVVNAKNMQGKLLLTVGELDTNVDPASTMQVASELIKANIDFELIVFPGGGHGSGESAYGQRRRMEFFVRCFY